MPGTSAPGSIVGFGGPATGALLFPSQPPAPPRWWLFSCGAECGLTSAQAGHWDAVVGAAPSLDSTVVAPNGGTRSYKWVLNGVAAYLAHNLSDRVIADRFYFNLAVMPNGFTNLCQYHGSVTVDSFVKVDSAGQVYIRVQGSAADIAVGSAVTAGTWHKLDVLVDVSGLTATMKARLDDGTEASDSVVQASQGGVPGVLVDIRRGPTSAAATGTINIDQSVVAIPAAYPIGTAPYGVVGSTYLNEHPELFAVGAAPPIDVTGTATGTGAASADATRFAVVDGTALGQGQASGAATTILAVTGAATGTGSASGAPSLLLGLTGSATGTGDAAAGLGFRLAATGSANGVGSASGDAIRIQTMTGAATGQGQIAGDVYLRLALTGSANGIGQATTPGPGLVLPATGSATGTGQASGAATRFAVVSGAATGVGLAQGDPGLRMALSGAATGTGNATLSLAGALSVTGTATGTGAAAGAVYLTLAETGSAAGSGQASADATRYARASGTAAGTGQVSLSIVVRLGLAGSATGTGSATGNLTALITNYMDPNAFAIVARAMPRADVAEASARGSVISTRPSGTVSAVGSTATVKRQ